VNIGWYPCRREAACKIQVSSGGKSDPAKMQFATGPLQLFAGCKFLFSFASALTYGIRPGSLL
jgi:hypothetical protein